MRTLRQVPRTSEAEDAGQGRDSADGTEGSLDARLCFRRMSGRSVVVPPVLPHDLVIDHFGALAGHHTDKWGVSDLVGDAGDAFGAG